MRATRVSLSARRAPPANDSNYAGSACPAGSAGPADLPAPPAPPAPLGPPTRRTRRSRRTRRHSRPRRHRACPASVRLASRHAPADDCNFAVPANFYQSDYFNFFAVK